MDNAASTEIVIPMQRKRIAWTAIFAGVVVTLVIQLLLSVLGLAIGISTVDPAQETNAVDQGLAIGAAIWWVVTALISLFVGGWAAGRLSGPLTTLDSTLHGFINWAVVTLVTIMLLSTAVGGLIGGGMKMIGGSAKMIGQGVASAAQGQPPSDMAWSNIRQEAERMLQQSSAGSGSQDQQISNQPRSAQASGRQQQSTEDFLSLLQDVLRQGPSANPEDREVVARNLSSLTGMSQQSAERAIERWSSAYQKVEQTSQKLDPNNPQAQENASKAMKGIASGAWWTFLALVLGAAASSLGGAVGTRRGDIETTHR